MISRIRVASAVSVIALGLTLSPALAQDKMSKDSGMKTTTMSKDKMSTSSDKMDSKEKMDTKDKKMKKKKDKMDKS